MGAKCAFCRVNHPEKYCRFFRLWSPQLRAKKVNSANLCLNCLGRDHLLDNCPSQNRCMHCYNKHHTMLCTEAKGVGRLVDSYIRIYQVHPILQCTAFHNNKKKLINILVDPKVAEPFIMQSSLRDIVTLKDEDRPISSLRLELAPPNAPWVTFEVVLAVKWLYHDLPHQSAIIHSVFSSYLGCMSPIANPSFSEIQRVDAVVGKAFLEGIKISNKDAPTLQNIVATPTKFGYLLQGQFHEAKSPPLPPNQQNYVIDITGFTF